MFRLDSNGDHVFGMEKSEHRRAFHTTKLHGDFWVPAWGSNRGGTSGSKNHRIATGVPGTGNGVCLGVDHRTKALAARCRCGRCSNPDIRLARVAA